MLDRARVRQVFMEAAELPSDQAAAVLDRECGSDSTLRQEVESLLSSISRRPAFLSAPTASVPSFAPVHAEDAPGMTIGHYRLLQQIGEGGFGTVYVAEQSEPLRRRVAVKVIKLGMDTRAVIARFEAERHALAMMDHAHIARVFDAGATSSGRPYFVMELVDGVPITAFCDRGSLNVPERLGVFVQVCRAVQHAHSKGVIHRDLKPGNVLVTSMEGEAHAKVIDFGIAKATQPGLTERSFSADLRQIIGTPEYMSPEQAESPQNVDTRTDVYSLGVLLYELLTGATPFESNSLRSAAYGEVQRIIREVEPPKPSTRLSRSGSAAVIAERRRTVPARLSRLVAGDLDWIVMKALEKDTSRRYDTASALATDIERHLNGEPVAAAPPSLRYRVGKFVRRHRTGVLAGGVIFTALVLGVAGTAMGLMTARREQHRAEAQATIATREADQARAINDFMRQVLTSVRPETSGADVRMKDVLAEASSSASLRFANHPLLEAEVRELLADVYDTLSLWSETRAQCERAVAIYSEHAGPEDPRTLRAERQVLAAVVSLGRVKEAEPALLLLLPRLERVLGPDHLTTIEAQRTLAEVHAARGRLDQAESMLRALREHPRLADDDRMQARILITLIRLFIRQAVIEDRDQRLAHWARIVPLAHECVERAMRAHGPRSSTTFNARVHLAMVLTAHEELSETVEMCRSVLAESREVLGECHNVRSRAMATLAKALGRQGHIDEPADLYLRCIECMRTEQQIDKVALLASLSGSMPFLARAGRFAEGESIAREVAAGMVKFGPRASASRANLFLAIFVSMAGRFDEAEVLFAPLYAEAEESGSPQAKASVSLAYAGHLMRLGRFEESEWCLERCALLKGGAINGTDNALPDDIVFTFIQLYRAWNKPDKLREYEAIRQEAFGIAPQQTP